MTSKSYALAFPSGGGLSGEASLSAYLQQIRKFPVLTQQEEYSLATRWTQQQDTQAAHKLVTSHLRLVAKLATKYRGYGLPMSELIAEGNIGLMQGVKKFDPERGFRLATYAMWWIKASMQEYILRSWSLVKIGTTAAQKKLFFNLRRMKSKLESIGEGEISPDNVTKIATTLKVTEAEVLSMDRRMAGGGDTSLNVALYDDGEGQWQDSIADDGPAQDEIVAEAQERSQRHALLDGALGGLNARERHIFSARRLQDEPDTLEDLSQHYNVSRERIRQIEVRAFEKVQKSIVAQASEQKLLEAA